MIKAKDGQLDLLGLVYIYANSSCVQFSFVPKRWGTDGERWAETCTIVRALTTDDDHRFREQIPDKGLEAGT